MAEVQGVLPAALDIDSMEGLTEDEKQQLVNMKSSMESCVRRYLGLEEGTACSLPKLYRLATK
eukprot:11002825-Lingulodinium_polyedra.AAC.1